MVITKRSIAINGTVTSISLEPEFWDELDKRATSYQLSWQEFVRYLLEKHPLELNRSATIRTYLLNMLQGELLDLRKQHIKSSWSIRQPSGNFEISRRGTVLIVGRGMANDIVLDDNEVSRRHVMLCWDKKNWWAVDLESKNGIAIKGKKINVVKLSVRIKLSVGNSTIILTG